MATRKCITGRTSGLAITATICTSIFLAAEWGHACGMPWEKPKSHFDGVDYQGNVMLVEQLGELDAGKGLKFPLWAVFGSNSGNNSPYVGQGWTIPLLEAKIVQVDENVFKIDQPNGWFRIMWRSKGNPNVLEGQGGWKAEIRGDTITAWADCGSKLVFDRGRLVTMQLKERKFDYVYEGNRAMEIKEGGSSILKVEKDAFRGAVTGFRSPGNLLTRIERVQRPRIQVVNNQNLVVGTDQALSKITHADGTVHMINYAVDGRLNPTMTVGDRLIEWSAASKKVTRDGEWSYEIVSGSGMFEHSAITRRNSKNQTEFWHLDNIKGSETIMGLDGIRRIKYWFASGTLAGKIRKEVDILPNGNVVVRRTRTYNESGQLIAEQLANGPRFSFTYDKLGRFLESKDEHGNVTWTCKYDAQGGLINEWLRGKSLVLENDKKIK